jgi:hypothetical protein
MIRHSDPKIKQVPFWSKNSCGTAVQQPTEPLPTTYSAAGPLLAGFLGREQEGVAFPLVVPLPMIMFNKSASGRRNEASPKKTSFVCRSHPSFGVRVQVWTSYREWNRFYATSLQRRPE